jgi:hypothetical protein
LNLEKAKNLKAVYRYIVTLMQLQFSKEVKVQRLEAHSVSDDFV